MIKILFLLLLVAVMVLLIWMAPMQPRPKLMTKEDHEALKAQEELEKLRKMNEHYKKHI